MVQVQSAAEAANYLHVRNDWLARRKEPILEPGLPIIDPHHHLWDRENWRYLHDDLLADTNAATTSSRPCSCRRARCTAPTARRR